MGIPRQAFWRRLPLPPAGDLPDPGTEPGSPALQADPLPSEPPGKPNPFRVLEVFPSSGAAEEWEGTADGVEG